MDTSKINHLFLKENYLLALNFPELGILPLRVMAREMIEYKYQAVSKTNEGAIATTGTVAADTYVDSARLTHNTYNLDNILRITNCNHVYQIFFGIKPSAIRQYLYYPSEKSRRNLDEKPIYIKSPFGFVDGFESPYDAPSEETEVWIPKGVDVGFAWWNPLSSAEQVDIKMLINRYLIKVVRDPDTVEGILKGKTPARIATLGGIDSFEYNARGIFNADLVPLDADRTAIEAAIKET